MVRRAPFLVLVFLPLATVARADVFHNYENFAEGFLGESVSYAGVAYRDANRVSGFYPDGTPFNDTELGNEFIIENAALFYRDFPGYGSPINALTFGTAYVPGENLTIGPLASVWMDLAAPGTAASLDLAYYENGPWGGIEYVLAALRNGQVVTSASLTISDLGGRDNPTYATLSVSGVTFDSLHLYAWLHGAYTAPRGMIDDLSVTTAVCRGDCNCDGAVNFEDINAFVAVLGGGTPCRFGNCDVNGDGVIDFADINPFVALLAGGGGPCP